MPPERTCNNRLLDSLPAEIRQRIVAASQLVELPLRVQLYGNEETPRFVYFPTAGVASVVFTSERGTSVELATQGNEGLVGWIFLLGPLVSAMECIMQVN